MDDDIFKKVNEMHNRFNKLVNPSLIKELKRQSEIANQIAASTNFNTIKIPNYSYIRNQMKQINNALKPTQDLIKLSNKIRLLPFQNLPDFSYIQSTVRQLQNTLNNVNIPKWFSDVTINDLNSIYMNTFPDELWTYDSTFSSEHVVSDGHIQEKIEEAFEYSDFDTTDRSSKLEAFFKKLLETAVYGEALQVVIITLKILFAIAQGIAMDNHDVKIKNEVQTIINDSKYGKAYQHIFVNESIEHPIAKLGYLRTDTLIRDGAKSTAPVSIHEVISRKTVVTLLKRKGNWIEIQVDGEDFCYIGWVEESKVIKFKVVE